MRIRQLKQADLARATGLAKGGISNYITGRYEPKSDVISKLAKALNCSEMWLWGYDVPMERQDKNNSPDELELSEGEKMLLNLFRQVPEDQQQLVLGMIRAALNTKG
jgi:transcriptional regulator with XRE-family HTH domain